MTRPVPMTPSLCGDKKELRRRPRRRRCATWRRPALKRVHGPPDDPLPLPHAYHTDTGLADHPFRINRGVYTPDNGRNGNVPTDIPKRFETKWVIIGEDGQTNQIWLKDINLSAQKC